MTTAEGPVLILAGAGTGKTRVITHRIAHLIQRGTPSAQILAVTFTNKAAREMKERVRGLLPSRKPNQEKRPPPTICTFHSLGVRILRQNIEKIGYKRNFVIYSESEQLSAVRKILSHLHAGGEKIDPRALVPLISRWKNQGESAWETADEKSAFLAQRILQRYESALRACNAVDFDDLLRLPLRLFEEYPDVLDQWRSRFGYVMVDEYQDTNEAQFRILYQLTCQHRNLCVVGDDDQSIYGWRGAQIANLLDMEKHFPEVRVIKLEQNYRSTNTILLAANSVIRNNAQRRGKQLWSEKGHGQRILIQLFANEEEESRTVVEEIEFNRQIRKIPWEKHAILFRTNIQSRPIETALRQNNVRYHLVGGQSFFDRKEIKDFVAYLKMLLNPHDDISLLRVANVPPRGLSDTTMERLLGLSHERQISVYGVMRHTDVQAQFLSRTKVAIQDFVSWIDTKRRPLEQEPQLSLRSWAENFLDEIGYWNELRKTEKNEEAAENRIRSVRDLMATLDEARDPGDKPTDRLAAFIEEIALDTERTEEKETRGDAVTLITIHSCKGLEFPHVYLVGMEEGLFPHSRSKEDGHLDEERRLFYVAITRAMESLTLTHCQGRKKYGEMTPCHPSRFLNELPDELAERSEQKGKQKVTVDGGKQLFAGIREMLQ